MIANDTSKVGDRVVILDLRLAPDVKKYFASLAAIQNLKSTGFLICSV